MKRPNILLIVSDQHRADFIEGEGDPLVATPNLRRLADNGMLFGRCVCPSPLCVPARMSMMTGRAPHRLNVWGNEDPLGSNIPTFAHALGAAGYRTVLAGRMHFMGGDQLHGFDERLVGDVCGGFPGQNRAEYRFRGYWGETESVHSAGPGLSHDQYYDQAVAAEACRIIRDHEVSKDVRPLLLVVGFYSPHDPYRAHEKYFRKYSKTGDLPKDPNGAALHPSDRDRHLKNGWDKITEDEIRKARSAYRGKCEFMDELAGQVIECFEESPLGTEGIIAYTSDHGEMLGDHGLWAKSCFYESALRSPLIMAGKGIGKGRAGKSVSLMDLAPTLAELAGAERMPSADGISLLPVLRGEETNERIIFCELRGTQRAAIFGEWKYVYSHGEAPQLFNLLTDPEERLNLAGSADVKEIEEKLKDEIFSDGWDPERNSKLIEKMNADLAYLSRWAQKTCPKDPVQWGLPAEL